MFSRVSAPLRRLLLEPTRLRVVVVYVLALAVVLLCSMPQGADTLMSVYRMPLTTDALGAQEVLGGSDAGSLLGAALSLYQHHSLLADQFGAYSFWPPGMIVVDLALIGIESAFGIPIVLSMSLLNCVLWAALLGSFVLAIWKRSSGWIAAAFAAFFLVYTGVSAWGLQTGLFFSDSFGAIGQGFALLFVIFAVEARSLKRRLVWSVSAGLAFAGACYFRASYELVAEVLLGAALAALLVALLARRARRLPRFTVAVLPSAVVLGVVGLVTQIMLLPWRAYAGLKIHPGDFRWSTVSDLMSVARWVPDSELLKKNGGYAIAGHSNWGCINDPGLCASIYDKESLTASPYSGGPDGYYSGADFDQFTLHSFLGNPFGYIGERLQTLVFGFSSNTGTSVGTFAIVESLILAVMLVLVIVVLVRRRAFGNAAYLFFLISGAVQLATLVLVHVEPRYFLGVELLILLFGTLVLAVGWRGPADPQLDAAIRSPASQREAEHEVLVP